jgi:hypothetical protein
MKREEGKCFFQKKGKFFSSSAGRPDWLNFRHWGDIFESWKSLSNFELLFSQKSYSFI